MVHVGEQSLGLSTESILNVWPGLPLDIGLGGRDSLGSDFKALEGLTVGDFLDEESVLQGKIGVPSLIGILGSACRKARKLKTTENTISKTEPRAMDKERSRGGTD